MTFAAIDQNQKSLRLRLSILANAPAHTLSVRCLHLYSFYLLLRRLSFYSSFFSRSLARSLAPLEFGQGRVLII